MARSKLREEKKALQHEDFARLTPQERLSLGAALSAGGKALLVREGGAGEGRTEPFRTLEVALGVLRGEKAAHALIGGWAVNAWGVARATADLDLLAAYPRPPETLLAALQDSFDAEWRPGDQDDPIDGLIRAGARRTPGLSLDILRAAKTADREALERAVAIEFQGLAIPVVRPEDLIAMKLDAGGALDWEDARAVYAVQRTALDEAVLESACARRRVLDRLARLRQQRKA